VLPPVTQERFGDWREFFEQLARFARGESDEFLLRFQQKVDIVEAANNLIEVKPGAFGTSINCNELLARLRKSKVAKGRFA
jgi:hypothetical protein